MNEPGSTSRHVSTGLNNRCTESSVKCQSNTKAKQRSCGVLLTFLGLVPDDAFQVDTGPWLAGPQRGRVSLQCSRDASILGVGADGSRPHRQLFGTRSGQGRWGERGGRGQRGPGAPGVTRSWRSKHGVHLKVKAKGGH